MTQPTLLVGAGAMARAHAAVFDALAAPYQAVARSPQSAAAFTAATGQPCQSGGIAAIVLAGRPIRRAIVATAIPNLADCALALITAGCRDILLEKPGGVTADDVARVADAAHAAKARIVVAYNRRFYESVRAVRRLASEDGGVVSFAFEFTEVADRVAALPYRADVLANWELANSTHVIDTAFFLGGQPAFIQGVIAGALAWHPRCARYAGHGASASGATFTYAADWDAPGRWGIEINTRRRRLILRPLESLQVQARGAFTPEPHAIDDALDKAYKPGLYRQMQAFLGQVGEADLIDIQAHLANLRLIERDIMGARKV